MAEEKTETEKTKTEKPEEVPSSGGRWKRTEDGQLELVEPPTSAEPVPAGVKETEHVN